MLDLTTKMVDTSPTVCTPRNPPRPPLPSRRIRLHTTRLQYPSTRRGFRRALRHPPATCSPNPPRGPRAPQVGPFLCLFPIMGPEFRVRLLRRALCPHLLCGQLSAAAEAGPSHRPPPFPPLCPSRRPRSVPRCPGPFGSLGCQGPHTPFPVLSQLCPRLPEVPQEGLPAAFPARVVCLE